ACSACGELATVGAISGSERRQKFQTFDSRSPIVPRTAITTTTLQPLSVYPFPRQPVITGHGIGRVRGRVIVVKTSANEPMDFDPWRWIAIPTWGFIILISPIVGAIIAWQSVGFIGAAGVALTTFF